MMPHISNEEVLKLSALSRHQMMSLIDMTAYCVEVIPRMVRRAFQDACFASTGNDDQLNWLHHIYASGTRSDDWLPRRIEFLSYNDYQIRAIIRVRDVRNPADLLWIHSATAFAEATPERIGRTFFSSLSKLHRLLRVWGFDSGPFTGDQMHILCDVPYPETLSMEGD